MNNQISNYDDKVSRVCNNMNSLSGLPSRVIPKIFEYISLISVHELMESLIRDDDKLSFVLPNIGEIEIIADSNDNISYKFIPTELFKERVESVVIDSTDPLLKVSMDKLKNHIINKYNEQL